MTLSRLLTSLRKSQSSTKSIVIPPRPTIRSQATFIPPEEQDAVHKSPSFDAYQLEYNPLRDASQRRATVATDSPRPPLPTSPKPTVKPKPGSVPSSFVIHRKKSEEIPIGKEVSSFTQCVYSLSHPY